MDWFLHDRDLRNERVNINTYHLYAIPLFLLADVKSEIKKTYSVALG